MGRPKKFGVVLWIRISTHADCNGAQYILFHTNLNVLREDSVVVIIDNPSKVKVMYYGSGQIDITDDTTVVYYCSNPKETRHPRPAIDRTC